MNENLAYLDAHFLSRQRLLHALNVSNEHLVRLVEQDLLPRPSYFPDAGGALTSNIATADMPLSEARFHPSSLSIARDGLALLQSGMEAAAIAADRRERFLADHRRRMHMLNRAGLVEDAVWTRLAPNDEALRDLALAEYAHWLAGTYGVCTRDNTAEAIAVKECMVKNVERLLDGGTRVSDRRAAGRLARYLRLFDAVTALFAPFERESTSRRRMADVAAVHGVAFG